MISVIVYGRNDSHGYNLPKRAALSFNCIAEVLTHSDDEIVFVDCNTPDDMPTFPESIADTLTPRVKELLRILRLRPASYEKGKNGTKFKVLEPLCRNVGIRRSNPANRWILNTNTDMVFTPLGGKSLSDIAARLADGFYELPRFEVPEILWESMGRMNPKAIIEAFHRWGRRLHLNEMVANMPEILFDGPGDFQLALRRQMFAIHGMNEQMTLGWHVDSNLCKRLFLLNGKTSSLLDRCYAYHCDHTRLNTPYHSATESTSNDWRKFFSGVTSPYLPEQAQTWGLPNEPVEEIRLTEEYATRYVRVLEHLLPGISEPMLKSSLMGESFNHGLLYDNQHILPYLADHLTMISPCADLGYLGANVGLLKSLSTFRQEYGHTGRILFDEETMRAGQGKAGNALPSTCVPVTADKLCAEAAFVCFDLWMGNFESTINGAGHTVPKPSVEGGRFAALMLRRLVEFARYERERFDRPGWLPRKFLFFGTQNTWFENATTQLFGVVLTPYSSYVRHGFVRKDAFARPFERVFGHHLLAEHPLRTGAEFVSKLLNGNVCELDFLLAESRLNRFAKEAGKSDSEFATDFRRNGGTVLNRAVLEWLILLADVDGFFERSERLRQLQAEWQRSPTATSRNEVNTGHIGRGPARSGVPTIAVDARTLFNVDSTSRGVGQYTLHHLRQIALQRNDWQFVLLADEVEPPPSLARLIELPNVRLGKIAEAASAVFDLLHVPDPFHRPLGPSPMTLAPHLPMTATFYDLIPLRCYWGGWTEDLQRDYLDRLEQLRTRAVKLFAISEYTRRDLLHATGLEPDRVVAVMAGLNRAQDSEKPRAITGREVRQKFGITEPFFLHVGALDPHKNFESVIKALGLVRSRRAAQLVVVGQKEHFLKQIADFVAQTGMKEIIFTGFIPRAELEALYAEAVALVWLSYFEGFGFPVLEAMAHGCPVITSNATSIPEVAGDGALQFKPTDIKGVANAMQQLLASPAQREQLRARGRAQAGRFNWEQVASRTIAEWEKILRAPAAQEHSTPPLAAVNNRGAGQESGGTESQSTAKPVLAGPHAPSTKASNSTPPGRPAPRGMVQPRNLVWFAPWQNPSGYCSEALSFAQGIHDSLPLELVDVARTKSPAFVAGLPERLQGLLREKLRERPDVTNKIVLQHMPGSTIGPMPGAAWQIGRTMFETDRLPASWVKRLNQMDEIWVPSHFNLETFAAHGIERDKLVVMPGSADERILDPVCCEPWPLPNRAGFNFLAVFEWSLRKGWDVLLSAYLREFSADDDVCLYLRCYLVNQPDGDPKQAIERLVRDHAASLKLGNKRLPRVEILAEQIAQENLPRLYKAVDCLVAPSRGEGWGRPQHEAMLMELPVIATNWSANTEFMTAENSCLLDYELVEAKYLEPEFWHYRGHRWANPSEAHLRQLMRWVAANPAEARAKGKAARAHMVENFSIAKGAERILARLQQIETKLAQSNCPPAVTRKRPAKAQLESEHSKPKTQNPKSVSVTWEGSFLDFGSLSHVNREITRQLGRRPGVQLACVGKNILTGAAAKAESLKSLARSLKAKPPHNAQVTVRHAWPPDWTPPSSGAWVLIQPWEFGALPAEWVQKLVNVDEVWVPSEYVRRVYVSSGIEPEKVKVVPNGIDPEMFHLGAVAMELPTRKRCKFLFVGGTIHRKGPDVLLQAFLDAFTAADDVCLVVKDFGGDSVYSGQTLEAQIRAAQARPGAPEIVYLKHELTPEALPGLYTACDCLVHPYRGEGFGLPVLEAMACGLPVIVTGGGATDDFATDEWAYRIPALRQNIGAVVGSMPLARDGWLLEPDRQALAEQMKWVAANADEARVQGRAASEYVRREWTWDRAAQIAHTNLVRLIQRKSAEAEVVHARRARRTTTITLPPAAKLGRLGKARDLLAQKLFMPAWSATLEAIEERPFHPEAWLLLAEIAQAAGDFSEARRCANHARQLAPKWKPAQQFLKSLPSRPSAANISWPSEPKTDGGSDSPASLRLTVCLITRNEERFLVQCLRSVRDLAHQIVVVDTGSTDRTVEIAREFGAEVHSFEWCDDFSAARNAALEHARGDWILSLDADEELLPEHRETLQRAFHEASVLAFRLPIVDKGREDEGVSYVPRLFRNAPGLFWVGRVHEGIFSSVEVRRQEWGLENKLGQAALLHHGYTAEMTRDRNKVARNLRLIERALEELPGEPNLLMNLGLELVRSGKLDEGLEQYWEAFHVMSGQPADEIVPELRETLLTQLCTHLMAAKRFDEIIRLLQTPLARRGGLTASMHFTLGLAHMEFKQYAEAAEQMRQCLATRERPALSPINKEIRKAGPNHCLALCLTELQKPAAALQAFQAAIKDDPDSRPARFDFARCLMTQNKPVEALNLFHDWLLRHPEDAAAWQIGGQLALSQPAFLEVAREWTAEALKRFPDNRAQQLQRAEALLLSQDFAGALPLWRAAGEPDNASHNAARILCEMLVNGAVNSSMLKDESQTSQEFLNWYKRLLGTNAREAILAVNTRLHHLRPALPGAARVLESALAQAGQDCPTPA